MEKIKKSFLLIGLATINLLHASLHLIQFIQSAFLLTMNISGANEHSVFAEILHSPIFSAIWGIIGLYTLWVGVKDYIHHKKCETE